MSESQPPQTEERKRKIDLIRSRKYSGLPRHAEALRRFFVATAGDIDVLIEALMIRLSELRGGSPSKEEALETLEVYAPIANRLGMGQLKAELETLAFPLAYPEEYKRTSKLLSSRREFAEKRLEQVYRSLRKYFVKESVPILSSDYRLKNIYSLYKKLCRPGTDMDITKVHDLLALRLITDSIENCYRILGLIHSKYKPMPGKVKDYIAMPKPNGYRSIHTTIYTGDSPRSPRGGAGGGTAEIQIRTKDMHEDAEFGVTSHIAYDESGKPKRGGVWHGKFSWVRELVSLARSKRDPGEFAEALEFDYFKNHIFVFTPNGDVIELPEEASVLDFAYAIHGDLGNHAHGAKVNGKYAALDTVLHGGETIEIEKRQGARPSRKWLDFARTPEARKRIRSYLAREKN